MMMKKLTNLTVISLVVASVISVTGCNDYTKTSQTTPIAVAQSSSQNNFYSDKGYYPEKKNQQSPQAHGQRETYNRNVKPDQ